MSKGKYLMIHCSSTPEGREVTREELAQWGYDRGWRNQLFGYSDFIHLDGRIENLVPYNEDPFIDPWEISNGARGYNGITRHVMYVGGCDRNMKPKDTRNVEQETALIYYVHESLELWPDIKLIGHNQVTALKACPSFDVPEWALEIGIPNKNIEFGCFY